MPAAPLLGAASGALATGCLTLLGQGQPHLDLDLLAYPGMAHAVAGYRRRFGVLDRVDLVGGDGVGGGSDGVDTTLASLRLIPGTESSPRY